LSRIQTASEPESPNAGQFSLGTISRRNLNLRDRNIVALDLLTKWRKAWPIQRRRAKSGIVAGRTATAYGMQV
jgi:hypothetical protein